MIYGYCSLPGSIRLHTAQCPVLRGNAYNASAHLIMGYHAERGNQKKQLITLYL